MFVVFCRLLNDSLTVWEVVFLPRNLLWSYRLENEPVWRRTSRNQNLRNDHCKRRALFDDFNNHPDYHAKLPELPRSWLADSIPLFWVNFRPCPTFCLQLPSSLWLFNTIFQEKRFVTGPFSSTKPDLPTPNSLISSNRMCYTTDPIFLPAPDLYTIRHKILVKYLSIYYPKELRKLLTGGFSSLMSSIFL